jgi:hypothetical protein
MTGRYLIPIYDGMTIWVCEPIELTLGTIERGEYVIKIVAGTACDIVPVGFPLDGIAASTVLIDTWLADGSARLLPDNRRSRAAIELALRAAAPMRPRGGQHSADVTGLALFEPTLL